MMGQFDRFVAMTARVAPTKDPFCDCREVKTKRSTFTSVLASKEK